MVEQADSINSFENDPLFLEVMAEALAIQDRFAAEPIYGRTGKGYLKSVGVEEFQALKKTQKSTLKQPPDES